ncbi:MAG TPA: energy-coupling factor transporter ATPase [Protaetiibacter sp.]|nr:energy-coupling factor transporter ATPase [Protaetiibacter sp.]
MTEAMIEVRDFSFSHSGSGSWQLQRIITSIRRGEKVAVMGATGAGKSTFAMALNGLIPHHHEGQLEGVVVVDGHVVADVPALDTVRVVGLVMQDAEAQITGQTVLTDAAVGPANFGLPREEVLDRAREALRQVGMAELEDRDTTQLSGGQRQRLAIAGIIAMHSEVLVLDEPTSELDPEGTAEVFSVVDRLSADRDATLVLIEHEPELIAEWADRLLVLREGRLVYDGPPEGFFSHAEQVEAAALRPPQVAEAARGLAAVGYTGEIPVTLARASAVLPRWDAARVRARPERISAVPGAAVIEARGLGHVYAGGVEALVDVDVTIGAGEFVAVLGRNGAGKTTFARHLNGLLRASSGSLRIAGEEVGERPVSELARHVGYVFQNPDHQIFAATVGDEVAYGLRNQGWEPDRIAARVTDVLEQVGMPEFVARHPFTLGKGERQRLAVASVLALEPEVLVIDEPTTGQDWQGAQAMMRLVEELNAAGHTIVMITHDMTLVARHARRALVFAGGRLIADDDPTALFARPAVLEEGRLVAPQVTRLAAALGCPSPVATVEDFLAEWGAEVAS